MKQIAFVCALAGASLPALAAAFTQGNLVVVRLGDGSAFTTGQAAPVFLDEYTTTGTLVQSIAMPTLATGSGNRALTIGNSAASEGFLARSADGSYLTLGGYNAAPGTAGVSSSASAAVNRVIGRVDATGAYDTSTAFSDAFSGASIRSVVSDNGTNFWATGGNGGVRSTSLGAAVTTQITSATGTTNTRVVNIFNGQLYMSTASSPFIGVSSIGSGLPTAATTASLLPGLPGSTTGSSSYDYYFASSSTLYIADDSAANRGLQKWELQAGTWVKTTTFVTGLDTNFGLYGITGTTDGSGNTVIYASGYSSGTSASKIFALTDTGAGSTFTTVITNATNTRLRGVEFAPIPSPGVMALAGVGGLLIARRRR